MASAEQEPITGVWGQSPQQGPGAEPLVGGQGGEAPPEAESLSVLRRRKETANLPLSCVLGSALSRDLTRSKMLQRRIMADRSVTIWGGTIDPQDSGRVIVI